MRLFAALALVLLLAGCAELAPPRSDAPVEAVSWTLAGSMLVGEMVNHGPSNAGKLRFVAEFFDASGASLGTRSGAAWRTLLEENETSPFSVEAPAGAASAKVTAMGESSRDAPFETQGLFPLDVKTTQRVGAPTNVTIEGSAVNKRDLPVTGVEAQVVFRDAEGKVVGLARATPDSPVIRAGESSTFRASTTLARDFLRYDVTIVKLSRST